MQASDSDNSQDIVISGADQINNFFMNDSETDDVEQKAKMLIKKPTDEKSSSKQKQVMDFKVRALEFLEIYAKNPNKAIEANQLQLI